MNKKVVLWIAIWAVIAALFVEASASGYRIDIRYFPPVLFTALIAIALFFGHQQLQKSSSSKDGPNPGYYRIPFLSIGIVLIVSSVIWVLAFSNVADKYGFGPEILFYPSIIIGFIGILSVAVRVYIWFIGNWRP